MNDNTQIASDIFGRQFQNLRVSLTAACNYACSYCVPDGEVRRVAKHELSAGALLRLVDLIRQVAAIQKLRITGGEPLIAPGFEIFLSAVPKMGFRDVSLTTNGEFLQQKLPVIVAAGIKRINVSLDTLNAEAFSAIARSGSLQAVLGGIDAALAAGIKIKINAVPLAKANRNQILPLLDYALERGIELRFIELMRMGHLANSKRFFEDYVSMADILAEIAQRYQFVRTEAPVDSTAARFHIPGKGYFGIIANETEPFCATCNRLRLSSSGFLHGCLSSNKKHGLAHLLDMPEQQALAALQDILAQAMQSKQKVFSGGETVMRIIGG